jgi:hypothetical protein
MISAARTSEWPGNVVDEPSRLNYSAQRAEPHFGELSFFVSEMIFRKRSNEIPLQEVFKS